jgi:hypothetical protein
MKKLLIAMTVTLICVGAFGQGKLIFWLSTDQLIYFAPDTTGNGGMSIMPVDAAYAGVGAYVSGNGGTQPISSLAGSPSFTAALYGGASAGSLSLRATTTIGDWAYEGQLVPQNVIFGDLPPGTPAFFQIQVYDSRATSAWNAWTTSNPYDSRYCMYAGESPVFTAVPGASSFPISQAGSPVNSTLPRGTFNLVDYPGAKGLIEVGMITPEPRTFALVGWGAAMLMIYRWRR